MKVAAEKIYLPVLVLLMLLQLYLPSFKANVLLQIVALMFFIFLENVRFSVQFLKQVFPLIILLCLGVVGTVFHKYVLYDILKDIFHFIKPLVGLFIGYIVARRTNSLKVFIKAIVIASLISAAIHFGIIFFMVRDFNEIESIREFTKDNFLEMFGVFFLLFYKKFEGTDIIKNPWIKYGCVAVLVLSCYLYYSRTMIMLAVIVVMALYGYTRITATTIKVVVVLILATAGFFIYLNNTVIRRDAKGIENFLYKVKNAPAEILETKINRDNHADLWDHWRAYEAKRAIVLMNEEPLSYVYGTGYGSLVNLKFFAPLTGDTKGIRYISDLHNGYINILYKLGIIGLMIYLWLIIKLYGYIERDFTFANVMISAIGVIYLITSIMITGMYNGRDIIIFILGGVLFYSAASKPPANNAHTNEHHKKA